MTVGFISYMQQKLQVLNLWALSGANTNKLL